ncbi:MAG: glycoside hydrolase family 31 protein [Bacteroidales bacterium]
MKVVLVFLLIDGTATAQEIIKTELGIKTEINSVQVELQFYSSSIVRIIKYPAGATFNKESLSVIKSPGETTISIKQKDDLIEIKTGKLTVQLYSANGKLAFLQNEKVLLSEKENGTSFESIVDAGEKSFKIAQTYVLEKDESIYGLGQQQDGKMSKRNVTLMMIQGNTDDYIPFFQSVKGYGIFWDNYSPTLFRDNTEGTTFLSDVGDGVDYYFMYGENADGVIACMRDLTGAVPMFPLWTYGYWQSKERYKSQDELVSVVKKYRELGVPLDGIIQDWQYWGSNYLWNAMDFLNGEFYDPKKMIDEVHKQNAHIIISIWNSFGPMTKQYRELEKINALFNIETWPQSGSEKWPPRMDYPSGVRVYDAYNPAARDIYWKYLNEGLFSVGIDGWWMDSSEPDHFNPKTSDFDTKTYLGSFRKVRNAFPLLTVGGVSQHQRSTSSEKRIFILTRSAFAGQQRYGANTWTGDVVSSWETLRNQISAGLNFSLCGIPHWNSDIGGFFLWNYKDKLKDPEYRELYVRWMQFGTFCPMMRSHGADAPREIYQFGSKGSEVYDALEKSINLRYLLLPYIYSTSWDVTSNNASMMRALMMDYADDRKTWDIGDQYLFGKSLMVCPVTQSILKEGTGSGSNKILVKKLYLPAGSAWYDFWTGEKHEGGSTLEKNTPLDIVPLYVKSGTILPLGPQVQYANEKKWDTLEIRIYKGCDGEFSLYEDENDNYNYEKGLYSIIRFSWNDKQKTLIIHDRTGSFPGMINERQFRFVVVDTQTGCGMKPGSGKLVSYSGKRIIVKM